MQCLRRNHWFGGQDYLKIRHWLPTAILTQMYFYFCNESNKNVFSVRFISDLWLLLLTVSKHPNVDFWCWGWVNFLETVSKPPSKLNDSDKLKAEFAAECSQVWANIDLIILLETYKACLASLVKGNCVCRKTVFIISLTCPKTLFDIFLVCSGVGTTTQSELFLQTRIIITFFKISLSYMQMNC